MEALWRCTIQLSHFFCIQNSKCNTYVLRINYMKKTPALVIFCWLLISLTTSQAQLAGSCSTCFDSQITKATKVNDHCIDYELKVFFTDKCAHALSHFTVAIPTCATIGNLNHQSNCKSDVGYDPTTGLTGFKIEAPDNFGKSSTKDITVSFRLCSNSSCDQLKCWSTQIAYKAGNCFELDSVKAPCTISPTLKAHLEKKNISCSGLADGQLTATVDQGTAPYQFTWSNGATTSSISNLAVGAYSVVIKDGAGQQLTLSDSIQQAGSIVIASTITNASCSGQSNGAIKISASGGSGGYSYLWSNGNTTDSLVNVPSGSYSVTVKDSTGCSASATFFINVDKKLMVNASNQLPACGQSNGSLSVTVTGGTEPYQYLWSNGDTTSVISSLPQGTYSVTVTDAEGCSTKVTYFLRENNTLSLSYSVTPTTCLDDASGAIDLTVKGGTGSYSYVWSNGGTTQDISGLTAGIYTVTVTDSLGCQRTARISVFKKTFDVSADIVQPKCSGDVGSISLTPSGGVSPYTYVWSNGATTSSIVDLSSGTYSVTAIDSTGCSKLLTYFITTPSTIQASTTVQNISCNSFSIDLTVTGGTSPYQYLWSTGAITQDVTDVAAGNYSISIKDSNGCSITQTVSVDSTATWSCLITPPVSTVTCNSTGNKLFTAISGATSYSWTVSSSDNSWTIQSGALSDTLQYTAGNINTTGTFTVTIVKDGCTQTCSYAVSGCTSGTGTGGTGGGNNESCGDCFKSTITKKSDNGSCATYVVDITTDGNCRYDLSHLVVAIPCGEITDYSDSANWPLVLGKDPTTGLTGLKVDNASNFGKAVGSFTLQFTVCYSSDCGQALKNWNPVVAYKAGQCIAYDTLKIGSGSTSTSVYPNPCKENFTIEVQCATSDYASIGVYDQYGRSVCEPVTVSLESGKNHIPMNASHLPQNIYFYRVKTSRGTFNGRILKSN